MTKTKELIAYLEEKYGVPHTKWEIQRWKMYKWSDKTGNSIWLAYAIVLSDPPATNPPEVILRVRIESAKLTQEWENKKKKWIQEEKEKLKKGIKTF